MRKTLLLLLLWSCSRNGNTVESPEAGPKQRKQPAEIVLPTQQAAGVIGVEILKISNVPELLQAPGKISLTDQSSWRIGVLTSGMWMLVTAIPSSATSGPRQRESTASALLEAT